MAKFNIKKIVVFSVVVVALVHAIVPISAIEEGEPKQLWDQCLTKMTPKCTLDIVESVFWNGTVSDVCCHELVQEGKLCHDILIKYMADRPSFIAREAEYLKRRDDVWNHCASISTSA
ncbi:PREDICTED: uncharacterized protein LOC104816777 [Tarenaya hassleriana]|uniref:uncharacterized protein LOC104816777 n=1 Tax=Tarenaya hassleriana TaxID=28532 RepID=UPI00053C9C8A|nr:PREDICTED: uncharacterized protein LOC104816777 [Tarenaya hassleriana]